MQFERYKMQLEQQLRDCGKNDVLVVADCADTLLRNKHFEQCKKWKTGGKIHIFNSDSSG